MAVVVAVTGRYNDQELKRAQADLAKLQKAGAGAATGLQGAFQKVGASLKTAGAKMSSVGKQATVGLTLPLAGVGFVATKMAGEFEQTMNQMQVAADLSGKQLTKMSDLALQMGADTVFSAQDASEAMLELAKSGITPAQIEAGALQASMALAATEGLNLSDAATITANSMATFGIEAKNAGRVADILAAGSQASTASVGSLSQALAQVGPGAHNAGLGLSDTVAVLAAFDQAGIKGSDAGTSLKTMLTRLVPSTDKAATAMADLGLKFTNARGNFLPMADVAEQLQNKLGGLSEKQRSQALTTIFGSDATRAATVLMRLGGEGVDKYTKATEKQGVAQKMADARMKGTAGAIEQMKGALETAGILIGQTIAPYVTMFAEKIADLAKWFGELDPTIQKIIVAVGAFAAAIGPVLIVLGAVVTGVGAVASAIGAVAGAIALGPLLAIVAAIGAAAFLIIKNWDTLKPFFINLWGAISHTVAQAWGFIQGTIFPAMKKVWGYIVPVIRTIGKVWAFYFKVIWEVVKVAFALIMPRVKLAMTVLGTIIRAGITYIGFWFDKIRDIVNAVRPVFSAIAGFIRDKLSAIKGFVSDVIGTVKGIWSRGWNGMKDVVTNVWDGIVSGVKGSVNLIIDALNVLIRGMNQIEFSAPDWVPGIGGKSWGVDVPEIPHLAEGGIVKKSFGGTVAVVGEGKYDEAVIPLTPQLRREGLAGSRTTTLHVTQHIDARGADPTVIPRVKAAARDAAEEAFAMLVRELRAKAS